MNTKELCAMTTGPLRGNRRARGLLTWFGAITLLLVSSVQSWGAQGPPPRLSPPAQVTMMTKDGVSLAGTYYPSYLGKKAVPILILHGWKGNRNRFDAFARTQQKLGRAVLTIDLRGHGESKRRRTGSLIDVDRMTRQQMLSIWLDVEEAKKFLMKENNEGKLNIDLLCVVAEDVSAIIALEWAVRDWNAPPLPTMKQGQDVKALVLLSPLQSFRGISARPVFSQKSPGAIAVRSRLSIMIVVGNDDQDAFSEASRIHTSFKRFRDDPPENPEDLDLVFLPRSTSLQGYKLLTAPGVSPDRQIELFIEWRLVRLQERFPWRERRSPLSP